MAFNFYEEFFTTAKKFYEAKPWDKLWDTDIFGVQDPETDETFFVEVMGRLGDHIAVGVYPDQNAAFQLLDAVADQTMSAEVAYEIPQVQLSFENREFLTPDDYNLIKKSGVTFRGKMAWPIIREYSAGRLPSLTLDEDLLYRLNLAMEQAIAIMDEYEDGDEERYIQMQEKSIFPVRRRCLENEQWATSSVKLKREENNIIPMLSPKVRVLVDELEVVDKGLEADFFMVPAPIDDEKGGAPYLPYCLLLVDPETGMVVGQELITVEGPFDDVIASIPEKIAQFFHKAGFMPREITVVNSRMDKLLQPLAALTGVQVYLDPETASINFAKQALMQFMKQEG